MSDTLLTGSSADFNGADPQNANSMKNGRAMMVPGKPALQSPAARSPDSMSGVSAIHSLRRCWPQMILSGAICGAAFAATAYFLSQPKYRSYATLRVHSQSPRLAFQVDEAEQASQFDVFKRTQRELVLSDTILLAALGRPEVSSLPAVRSILDTGDPVMWLRKQLRVDFPGDAEIMSISFESSDPRTSKTVVDAVLQAYVFNVVDAGKKLRSDRADELRQVLQEQEDKARKLRSRLETLTASLGSGDKDALSVKQQVAIQRIAQLQTEFTRVQLAKITANLERDRLKEKLDALPAEGDTHATAAPNGPPGRPPQIKASPAEVDALVRKDGAVAAQREVLAKAQLALEETEKRVGAERVQFLTTIRSRVEQERATLSKLEAAAREEILRKAAQDSVQVRQDALVAMRKELEELESKVSTLEEHERVLDGRLAVANEEAANIGASSFIVESTRAELERIEAINNKLGTEFETLTIELQSRPRVESLGEARAPQGSTQEARLKKAATFGVLGFLLPCVGLIWLDFQRKLVNGTDEVHGLSRMRTLGALPIVRRQKLLRHGGERGALALREAVDGIRTVLIREADVSDYRVIQITSAVGGEAKTTFAGQLARSLARAHRRTVLVDMDLRRPTLHDAFGAELTAGVCEVLRRETRLEEVIRPSDQDGLSLVFAGRCDRVALAGLTNCEMDDLVTQLREQFEFVIIDSSPVLPVVDSLLIAQRADAIILTAMRDVSRAPHLREARDRLWQVGANVIGSVVTTKENRSYYGTAERYVDV